SLSIGKHAIDILLGIANVFADYSGKIQAQDLDTQTLRNSHRCHRLARSTGTKKERGDAPAIRKLIAKLPSVEHARRETNVVNNFIQLLLSVLREDHLVETEHWFKSVDEVRYS